MTQDQAMFSANLIRRNLSPQDLALLMVASLAEMTKEEQVMTIAVLRERAQTTLEALRHLQQVGDPWGDA